MLSESSATLDDALETIDACFPTRKKATVLSLQQVLASNRVMVHLSDLECYFDDPDLRYRIQRWNSDDPQASFNVISAKEDIYVTMDTPRCLGAQDTEYAHPRLANRFSSLTLTDDVYLCHICCDRSNNQHLLCPPCGHLICQKCFSMLPPSRDAVRRCTLCRDVIEGDVRRVVCRI